MTDRSQQTLLQGSDNGAGQLNAQQCRMARAGLALGVRDLAQLAAVSTNTITRLERGEAIYTKTAAAIRTALEAAGVEFIAESGGGAGVRLRKPAAPSTPIEAEEVR